MSTQRQGAVLSTKVPAEVKREFEQIALDRSEPGAMVREADLLREAIENTYGIDADLSSAKE